MEIYLPLTVAVVCSVMFAAFWIARARLQRPDRPRAVVELPDEAAARVDGLIVAGKNIEAVKAVRDATGASLQSGVDTVEARRARMSGEPTSR